MHQILKPTLLSLGFVLISLAVVLPQRSLAEAFQQDDLISVGVGYANFDRDEPHRRSADLRFDYRWGNSLLSSLASRPLSTDNYFQIHPFIGFETSTLDIAYGLGGIATDFYLGSNLVFTWSEGIGLFYPGNGMSMGSIIEIRSMGELGLEFENQMRLSAFFSHTSNAKITNENPGSEVIGFYLHVPLSLLNRHN